MDEPVHFSSVGLLGAELDSLDDAQAIENANGAKPLEPGTHDGSLNRLCPPEVAAVESHRHWNFKQGSLGRR